MTGLNRNGIAWPTFFHRQEMISRLFGCRRKAPRQVHDDTESRQDHLCCCKLVIIRLSTGLQIISDSVKMEHNNVSVSPSLRSHVIMRTRSFVDQPLSFDFNAEISYIKYKEKNAEKEQ